MMASRAPKGAQRSKASAERARKYAARTSWHESQISRRVRDNTFAAVVGGLIIVSAIVSQSIHAAVAAPESEPDETTVPTVLENPFIDIFESPLPTE
jgi:hypothetical protein